MRTGGAARPFGRQPRQREGAALVGGAQAPVVVFPVVVLRVNQRIGDQARAPRFAGGKKREEGHGIVVGESGVAQHHVELVLRVQCFVAQQHARLVQAHQVVVDIVEIEDHVAMTVDR